jgi:hypothetical protein
MLVVPLYKAKKEFYENQKTHHDFSCNHHAYDNSVRGAAGQNGLRPQRKLQPVQDLLMVRRKDLRPAPG